MNRANDPAKLQSSAEEAGKGEDASMEVKTAGANRAPPGPAAGQVGGGGAGQKRPFADISNEQGYLVPGAALENESGKIDIKEDGFFAGPYKQERMLTFQVEQQIEEAEMKEELTVGDRTSNTGMCVW